MPTSRTARSRRLTATLLTVTAMVVLGACADSGSSSSSSNAGGDASASGTKTVKVIVPVAGSLANLSLYVAEANGYLKKNGLEVELSAARGGGPDIAAVTSGDVDFDITSGGGLIGAVENGSPLVSVMVVNERPIASVVMRKDVAARKGVSADSPLERRFAALNGSKVGVSTPGGFFAQLMGYYAFHGKVKDVTTVPAGDGGSALAAFKQGTVDALAYSSPVVDTILQSGDGISLLRPAQGDSPELEGFFMTGLAARRDYVEKNPDTVRKLVASLLEASKWVKSHSPDEIAAAIKGQVDQQPEVLKSAVATMKDVVSADGCASKEGVDATVQFFLASKYIKKSHDWTEVTSNDYLGHSCGQ